MTWKTFYKQSVASFADCFRYHWGNYKCNDRKYVKGKACLQEYVFEYLNSEGHNGFLLNVSVTLIDKTDGNKSLGTNGPPDKNDSDKTHDICIPFDPF